MILYVDEPQELIGIQGRLLLPYCSFAETFVSHVEIPYGKVNNEMTYHPRYFLAVVPGKYLEH